MKRFIIFNCTLWIVAFQFSPIAQAHGGHDPRLKVAVSESEIRVETSLTVDAFMAFDTDRDNLLTVTEYETQYNEIAAWIDKRLSLSGASASTIKPYFSDSPIVDRAHLKKNEIIENIKILRRFKTSGNDEYILTVAFYENEPTLLYSRSRKLNDMSQFKICNQTAQPQPSKKCVAP